VILKIKILSHVKSYLLNNDYLEQIKNNSKSAELNDIKGNLIKLCENTGITDSNDYTTVY